MMFVRVTARVGVSSG
jgi:hypothetical protein